MNAALLFLAAALTTMAQEKITYDDQVSAIFRNNCFKCHNSDKAKGELDLTTYSAVLKGGGSGKAVLPGDAPGSKLFKSITRTEEPFMPYNSPKLPDADIELVRKWIAGGLLEKSSSQALAANKLALDLTLKPGSAHKPSGPAILPVDWLLEPVRHTERANAVTALAASPWSPVFAVGGQHQLLVYHSDTLELAGVLPFPDGNPECVQFSRDGRLLLIGGGQGAKLGFADLYDVATGERVLRVGNEYDTVLAADLNADQTEVALGGPGKHVKVFSTKDGKLVRDLKKHTDWVTALEYSPDSVLLASGDRNGGLVVWEADSGQELYTLAGHQAEITSVSWRDDSEVLLSASEDGSIHIWEMRDGKQVAKWTAHSDGVLDARFAHDARIVSCGRDQQLALWDASGKKLRSWNAGGPLPVRATFSHDGARVFASSWQGDVGVWTAADGKPAGDVTSNPPTLAERLEITTKAVQAKEAGVAKSEAALNVAEAEATKIKTLLTAQDKSSPAFQFAAAARQAQAAQHKAAEEARKGLDKLKAAAEKSATELAAAEAAAAKTQAALDKVEKFTDPYKSLAQQVEAASKKLAAATTKVGEARKALADKTATLNASAAELTTKLTEASGTRDQAAAVLAELAKKSEVANQALTLAQSTADQDRTRLSQQQAAVGQAKTVLASAEAEAARITLALNGTNSNPQQSQELTRELELATRQGAEARVVQENGQKTLGDLQTAANKSAATLTTAEADAAKLKASMESAQKSLASAKDAVTKLETAKSAAAESAKKETDALQGAIDQASSALATAKSENAELQARLEKTEKLSDAFKEASSRLAAANKQVAAARVPAEHDRKEVADLQAVVEKMAVALTAADAESSKATLALARNDPSYLHYQELEHQLEAANQKVSKANATAENSRHDLGMAKSVVTKVQAAQVQVALRHAREVLAGKKQQHEKLLATVAAAEADNAKVIKELNEAQAACTGQPARIKTLQTEIQSASKAAEVARAALKEAGRAVARDPESESTATSFIEKQNTFRAATNQVQVVTAALKAAQARLPELSQQVTALTQVANTAAAKLETAKATAADSNRQLAAENDQVAKLAAEHQKLKSAGL
jgi:Planctomycete cytochrome C/Anaphase-promoting complex subunit 4 WD40 domain